MPTDIGVSAAQVGKWAEENLILPMVDALIASAAIDMAEETGIDEAVIRAELEDGAPGAWRDARQIVRAVEKHYKRPIEEVAADLDADPEDLAYYLVMQSLGHGVAWTDDHDTELWTPQWDAAMWGVMEDAAEVVDDLEESDDEDWDEDEDEE